MSARALSLAIGRSEAYIQGLESGLRNKEVPKEPIVRAIARELDTTVDFLVYGVQGPQSHQHANYRVAEDNPWYVTATDEELMARAGVTPVPAHIAAYVRAVAEFGGELGVHAGEHGHVNPQELEDSFGRKLDYQTRHGDPLHWTRVWGNCMEPKISDGDMVYLDRSLPPEPGKFYVAIVNGEQAIARKLNKVNGRFWLETLDGAPPQLVTDGVRLIGRVVYRQSVFA